MAKIFTGILGGFSGKVGSVIGFCMNGVAYMRGLATGHTDANTLAQQDQRAKFSLVIKFLRPLIGILRNGFDKASATMSGFASAVSYTLQNAVTGVSPAFAIDYTKVLVTRGNLAGALNPVALSVEAGKVDFSWDNNSWELDAETTDKVVLVVYHPILNKAVTAIGAATRAIGSQSVELPAIFEGGEVQCYIGFTNDKIYSNGEWLAAVNVL